MKPLLQQGLLVKPSLIEGYGVFAGKTFDKDSIIEECYVIISSGTEDALKNYYFRSKEICLIPTGFGLIYNHCDQPNATYYFDETRHLLLFKALRCISPGEEIMVSYGKNWFANRGLTVKKMSWLRKLLRVVRTPFRFIVIMATLWLATYWLHVLAVR